ncbi:unnamed protein product [Camellia sinensis]
MNKKEWAVLSCPFHAPTRERRRLSQIHNWSFLFLVSILSHFSLAIPHSSISLTSAANLPLHILTCAATMALRMATLKSAGEKMGCAFGLRRWTRSIAQPPPLDTPMSHTTVSSPLVLPEHDHDSINNNNVGFEFPSFCFGGGSMELMAVPKRKVSPHKRGIRNGPKALKPVPVIIRCNVVRSCGRVKLPHFYCCSGDRGNTGERNGSSS